MLAPLLTLKRILQDAGQVQNKDQLMNLVVNKIQAALTADVCSLYLIPDRNELVLSATFGLDQSAVGKIRMLPGTGLVGTVAASQHTLNLERGDKHPAYLYFSETGEERFKGFLGVPMIHLGQCIGVLVVQVKETRKFTDEEEAFLLTMAAQLAGSLGGALISAARKPELNQIQRYHGIKGAPGIRIAKAIVIKDDVALEEIPDKAAGDPNEVREKLENAIEETLEELERGMGSFSSQAGETLNSVLEVYSMLLASPELKAAIEDAINQGLWAGAALRQGFLTMITQFEAMSDSYLAARAEDLRILGQKVYRHIAGAGAVTVEANEPIILVGKLISVSHFARIPVDYLVGVVSEEGSALSHTGVLANALGVPAVMGLRDCKLQDLDNQEIILDGNRGIVIAHAPDTVLDEYKKMVRQEQALQSDLAYLKGLPAETKDGVTVSMYTNTGLLADITPGLERGAEGIGLYRSEIPFMVHKSFPTEEEQVRIYRGVLEAYQGKPVTMRTLDIGGDKALPYFPIKEENPFLGWRGVRFTLHHTNILLDQIRAMLMASVGLQNLQIMVPMVSREDELDSFLKILDQALLQLSEEGYRVVRPKVGIMVEVPSIIWMLPRLADRLDFISIGSNDLTQYLLAVDRNNAKVADLYDPLHPSVINAIEYIVREAARLQLPVSVCGEMASDPVAVILLLAMGVNRLSLSAYNLPRIKSLIRHLDVTQCQNLLEEVRVMKSEKLMRNRLKQYIEELGLGMLISS